MQDFVHLHVHTQYSILDGQASIPRLVDKAMANGMRGIAVTDHGVLARKAKSKDFGSYKYRGEWGLLDHLIVSGTLLNQSNHFFTSEEKANVCLLPFLLKDDEKYGDKEPFRTYKGMKYQGGISDHLPIYTDFELILH